MGVQLTSQIGKETKVQAHIMGPKYGNYNISYKVKRRYDTVN